MPVFEPVSEFARSINNLFAIMLLIAACVLLVVASLLIYFGRRYRAAPSAPDPEPSFGDRKIEIVLLDILSLTTARAADPPKNGRQPYRAHA
jgi:heme/copper-type cytochrome/quinol oxidase subunit 2